MSVAEKFTASAAAVTRHVDEVRAQIAETSDEIAWLETSPPPKSEIAERVCASIDREAAIFVENARWGGLVHEGAISELLELTGSTKIISPDTALAGVNLSTSPLLAFLFGDVLKQKFTQAIEAGVIDFAEGPPTSERPALIEAALERLNALGREEEGLIEEAESVGIEIARRADADPATVLGAYEAHVYKFKAAPVNGDYHFGEIESDVPLIRSEILARARHALPSEWLERFELESIEILERPDSGDIIDDGTAYRAKPRTAAQRPTKQKQVRSPSFERSATDRAALVKDLGSEEKPLKD